MTEGGRIELVVTKVGDAEKEVTVTLSTQDGTAGSKRVILKYQFMSNILTLFRKMSIFLHYFVKCI